MEAIKDVLAGCLHAAGEIQKHYFAQIHDAQVQTKSTDMDLQTVADVESEKAIVERIRHAFPDHSILTEEGGGCEVPGATTRWIIDPLDGTTNFRHGFPEFAISIGVEVEGELRLGAVYNPQTHEVYEAEKGHGATCNGIPIHVSRETELSKSLLVMGFPHDRLERLDHYMDLYKRLMTECHGVLRLGSAALNLCRVASGQLEGYYEENIESWDWAAGAIILEEAGGRLTDYHGEARYAERRQFCATNGLIHKQMLAILGPAVGGTPRQ